MTLLANPGQLCAEFDQHLRGSIFALADQPQQDVLGADVVMAELKGLCAGSSSSTFLARGVKGMCVPTSACAGPGR